MAIYDLHRSTAEPLSTRIATVTVDLVIRMIDARNARATRKALGRLTDHELNDIGLSRCNLATFTGR